MSDVLEQFSLSGKVGLVTGAGSGIGQAYAEALSEAGARVACIDIDSDDVRDVTDSLETEAIAIEADVTSESEMSKAVDRTNEELGQINAAFANAGIGGAHEQFEDYPLDKWESVINVNLTGVFITAREVARSMIDTDSGGTIVSTASIYGFLGSLDGTSPAYAASKGGVVNLTREMAVSLAPHGIRVNAIAPGFVDTPLLNQGSLDESDAENFRQILEEKTLLGRLADPADLKATAIYLASPASAYVAGQTLVVDGGWLAQ